MKKLLFVLASLTMLAFTAYAQDKQNEENEDGSKSKTVELLQKDGILLKKDFYNIGKVGEVDFENIVLTDVSTGNKTGALRIKTYYYSSVGLDTYIGTLDYEELAGCIKALEYIKNSIITSMPENYVECEYRTKDGVCLGSYLKANKKNKEWRIYIQTKRYTNRSQEFLGIDKIDEIISLLNKSLENLNENM